MAPKDILVLTPGTGECEFIWKEELCRCDETTNLETVLILDYLGGPNDTTTRSSQGRARGRFDRQGRSPSSEGSSGRKGNVMRGREPRNAGSLQKLEKAGEQILPLEALERIQS